MNTLTVFENKDFGKIRTTVIDGEPWFVGKDVASALGYINTKDALSKHVDGEDKRGSQITTPSGEQTMTCINESGLYSLTFASKLKTAKEFKRWVTHEVLPSIRKTGKYETPKVVDLNQKSAVPAVAPNNLASLISVTMQIMKDAHCTGREIASMEVDLLRAWDVPVPTELENAAKVYTCDIKVTAGGKASTHPAFNFAGGLF